MLPGSPSRGPRDGPSPAPICHRAAPGPPPQAGRGLERLLRPPELHSPPWATSLEGRTVSGRRGGREGPFVGLWYPPGCSGRLDHPSSARGPAHKHSSPPPALFVSPRPRFPRFHHLRRSIGSLVKSVGRRQGDKKEDGETSLHYIILHAHTAPTPHPFHTAASAAPLARILWSNTSISVANASGPSSAGGTPL